jgi:Fanconi anemia group D2 protein
VTAALEVLVALAEGQTEDLLKFASFIGMLLDYLANFTDEQLHLVFQLFSQLVVSSANSRAMAATSGGSRIEDELHIVITKQLSSADPRFKRIGIIGTVTHIRQLSAGCEELDPEVRAERHGEAIRMLSAMLAGCRQQPRCLCFLYDELSTMVAVSSCIVVDKSCINPYP